MIAYFQAKMYQKYVHTDIRTYVRTYAITKRTNVPS